MSRNEENGWDTCEFRKMLMFAYEKAFIPVNIRPSFKGAGVYPLNASAFLSSPLLKHNSCMNNVLTVEELEYLFEEKKKQVRKESIRERTIAGSTGYVGTTYRELTSEF